MRCRWRRRRRREERVFVVFAYVGSFRRAKRAAIAERASLSHWANGVRMGDRARINCFSCVSRFNRVDRLVHDRIDSFGLECVGILCDDIVVLAIQFGCGDAQARVA